MILDDLDKQLDHAWNERLAKGEPSSNDRRLKPDGPTMNRPLRSWALALRANDARLDTICPIELIDYHDWPNVSIKIPKPAPDSIGTPPCQQLKTENSELIPYDGPECAIEAITIDKHALGQLVRLIRIPYPGLSIDAAARTCGVNRTTIHRWVKKGTLIMDTFVKRNGTNRHRADKRVWSRVPLDVNGVSGGQVWSPEWNVDPEALVDRLPGDWKQVLMRSHRCLGRKSVCRFFKCPTPGCGKWVYKVFMPMGIWTMPMALGMESPKPNDDSSPLNPTCKCGATPGSARAPEPAFSHVGQRFTCHCCAKLIYESAERTSKPAPNCQRDSRDLFIRRLSGGVLRGRNLQS